MIPFRVLLLVLSTAGFWELLRRRFPAVHPSFLPGLTVALQACLLLLGGLLNVLRETAWLLGGVGTAALAYSLVRDKGKSLKYCASPEYLFLGLGLAVLFFCVRGKVFTHYDNFSHWAQVLSKMLKYDCFPGREYGVLFENYPLGSTVFVYFVVTLTGGAGEPLRMLAQAYMLLACVMPLFSLCRRNALPAFLLIAAAANFLFSYNIQVTELLVDTLLPLVGMCALLFVYTYRDRIAETAPLTALYLVWMLQIKNSAVFFALACGIPFLYYARKNRRTVRALICLGAALAGVLAWRWHCSAIRPDVMATEHSLSISWWATALRDKSTEDIKRIILSLAEYAACWRDLWYFMLFPGVTGLFALLRGKPFRRMWLRTAGAAAVLYLAYQAGLLLMYIFSMRRSEAMLLSSVARYEKSVLIALYYLLTALAVRMMDGEKRGRAFAAALALLLSFGAASWGTESPWSVADYRPYRIGSYDGLEVRRWMEGVKAEYSLPEDGDYAIVISDWDSDYFWCLGMYLFPQSDIAVVGDPTEKALEGIKAQQVLIYDGDHPAVREWIHRNYPGREGRAVIDR